MDKKRIHRYHIRCKHLKLEENWKYYYYFPLRKVHLLTGHPVNLVVANSIANILNKSNKYSSVSYQNKKSITNNNNNNNNQQQQ